MIKIPEKYMPILSISPAEMGALEELAEKDKDLLLPIFPIKGWVGSHKLENTEKRIIKAFGNRPWIASISEDFLDSNSYIDNVTGEYKREVFQEIENLLSPEDGFKNWVEYISKIDNVIPSLISINTKEELKHQVKSLYKLNRGISVIFSLNEITSNYYLEVLETLVDCNVDEVIITFDFGSINTEIFDDFSIILQVINSSYTLIPSAFYSISASSFPSSFAGRSKGEHTIHERRLFNQIKRELPDVHLIYSDHGGARVSSNQGGGGVPAPRIDYPLKNEWHFIRREFQNPQKPEKGEKERLYTEAAKEIIKQEYWNEKLYTWGTQVIVYTSKGESIGINSAAKSTAVRLNIHMYNQLHYDEQIELVDSDDDWED